MRYISTRAAAGAPTASFSDILLEGLAADGGLYVPEQYPTVTEVTLDEWRALLADRGYAAFAAQVLALFVSDDDIPHADLARLTAAAYTKENFGTEEVVPVSPLGDGRLVIGHLSNGPTAAFKDMAMQLLGRLFEYELGRRGDWLTVVGATSGDTGSAAEYAIRGLGNVSIVMLTPAGRMTPFQQAQMFSLDDPNVVNVAVDGVFDDCQDLVKALNADADFKARHHVGAVNSMNWARVVAQVVYYVAAWLRTTTANDQRVSVAVPTGNFGNILAGHVAREMGVPLDTLILATNENNVLDEFFRTGVYRPRPSEQTWATSSPSMDISKASNFERFVYDLLGRDGDRVRELFVDRLGSEGSFDLSGTAEFAGLRERYGFVTGSSTHADRVDTIRDLWESEGVLIDPHTADAVKVARELLDGEPSASAGGVGDGIATPVVVMETALPAKFSATIVEAIAQEPTIPERFEGLSDAGRHVVDLPNDVAALKSLVTEHVQSLRGAV